MEDIKTIVLGALGSLFAVWLSWLWARGRLAWTEWQARPSAQEREENDMEAARRLAGNTQRLIVLFGGVMVMLLGLGALCGFTLVLGWGLAHGFPLYASVASGLLLGMALVCRYTLQYVDKIQLALREEEQRRLAELN